MRRSLKSILLFLMLFIQALFCYSQELADSSFRVYDLTLNNEPDTQKLNQLIAARLESKRILIISEDAHQDDKTEALIVSIIKGQYENMPAVFLEDAFLDIDFLKSRDLKTLCERSFRSHSKNYSEAQLKKEDAGLEKIFKPAPAADLLETGSIKNIYGIDLGTGMTSLSLNESICRIVSDKTDSTALAKQVSVFRNFYPLYFHKAYLYKMRPSLIDSVLSTINDIRNYFDEKNSFNERMVWDDLYYVILWNKTRIPFSENDLGDNALFRFHKFRDSIMADNFFRIMKRESIRKAIINVASYHSLSKSNSDDRAVFPVSNDVRSFGEYIEDSISKKDIYRIAIINLSTRSRKALSKSLDSKTIERQLAKKYKYCFVDLSAMKAAGAFYSMPTFKNPILTSWQKLYDGLIIIR